jgi:lipoyl(octanoyl) transferase
VSTSAPTPAETSSARRTADEAAACEWAWLGKVGYAATLALQEKIRDAILAGRGPETLLLLEHEPVITLGRHGNSANILTTQDQLGRLGVQVTRTTRGGDVTYHGPGQLVGYPVFRLRAGGVRAHMVRMGAAIQSVLADLGIEAVWRAAQPGLWVGNDKICAVGVHVRRRVAMHGFALNVNNDLDGFEHIVPCGIANAGVTSIAKLGVSSPTLAALAERVAFAFERSFALRILRISADGSRLQNADGNL